MNANKKPLIICLNLAILGGAAFLLYQKFEDYLHNPWTRNGQVFALVVQITPRVSGPLVKLPIADNQFVKAGTLLFEIDPRTFKARFDQARAQLDQTGGNVDRFRFLIESMPPADYLRASYYERWLASMLAAIERDGLLDSAQLEQIRAGVVPEVEPENVEPVKKGTPRKQRSAG